MFYLSFFAFKGEKEVIQNTIKKLVYMFYLSFFAFKGEKEVIQIFLERYPCVNKNLWWSRFFLIRLDCRDIPKNFQNETTKHI